MRRDPWSALQVQGFGVPDLVGAQVVELDVAVVVAGAHAALLVVEAVAEAHAPAVARLPPQAFLAGRACAEGVEGRRQRWRDRQARGLCGCCAPLRRSSARGSQLESLSAVDPIPAAARAGLRFHGGMMCMHESKIWHRTL